MRLAIAAFLLVAPIASAAQYGFVYANDTTLCVSLSEPLPHLPSRAVAAFFEPAEAVPISIVEKLDKPCAERPEGLAIAYRAEYAGKQPGDRFAFGVVAPGTYSILPPGSDGSVRLRDASHAVVRLRECASSEGLHLTAWKGTERLWHEYAYLGYDVDPTCTEEEWRE